MSESKKTICGQAKVRCGWKMDLGRTATGLKTLCTGRAVLYSQTGISKRASGIKAKRLDMECLPEGMGIITKDIGSMT